MPECCWDYEFYRADAGARNFDSRRDRIGAVRRPLFVSRATESDREEKLAASKFDSNQETTLNGNFDRRDQARFGAGHHWP